MCALFITKFIDALERLGFDLGAILDTLVFLTIIAFIS